MRLQTRLGPLRVLLCILSVWSTAALAADPQKAAPPSAQQERWDAAYREGRRAPWDIGRPSTDLKRAVENGTLRPCRVVELGCGSGNDSIYLAGNANESLPHYGPPRVREADIRADFGPWFEFQWLRATRFDTTDPNRKGALAWSILLRRKAESPAAKAR